MEVISFKVTENGEVLNISLKDPSEIPHNLTDSDDPAKMLLSFTKTVDFCDNKTRTKAYEFGIWDSSHTQKSFSGSLSLPGKK